MRRPENESVNRFIAGALDISCHESRLIDAYGKIELLDYQSDG